MSVFKDANMKTRLLYVLLASGLLLSAAWLVHAPNPTQADQIPDKYRATVSRGLEYLVKNQAQDGHWEGDDSKHPVVMTGLVGLALLMERTVEPRDGGEPIIHKAKHSANIRKAADWLLNISRAGGDGLIFSGHHSETERYMQGHGLATLFLAGVCMEESDVKRRKQQSDVLTSAVKYIARAQSSQGGWYHTSRMEGHDFAELVATVVQMQAVQAAENAGVPIPAGVIDGARGYLRQAVARYEENPGPGKRPGRATDLAAALAGELGLGRYALWDRFNAQQVGRKWFMNWRADLPVGGEIEFGRDELTHYFYAQAVFDLRGETWTSYRTAMFDHLKNGQHKDGSWPAGDGLGVGTVYATAVWSIILQLDRGSHPVRPGELIEVSSRGLDPKTEGRSFG
jgi:hypothetical protein